MYQQNKPQSTAYYIFGRILIGRLRRADFPLHLFPVCPVKSRMRGLSLEEKLEFCDQSAHWSAWPEAHVHTPKV
jgi:hypothetical protein